MQRLDEKAVYSGWLYLPPQTKINILKKTWQQKFCLLYKANKCGIQRLEIYENLDEVNKSTPKIIALKDCVKVSKKSQTYFTVVTKSGNYDFGTATEKNLDSWIQALQTVAFPDDVSSLVEDNDLYCSIGEGIYNVKLYETDASIRCNLLPKDYILMLTATAIQLREVNDNKLLYTWPYIMIRRYGYSNGKFTFEAGRKCDSGEGKFLLEHSNEQEIFRYVTMKMKSMKQLLRSDSVPNLDCDKQLQAMLNMEARSRSPLPPSSDMNQLKIRGPPIKPPRKYLPKDDYDEVEVRNNAWETLGTTDVVHTEECSGENLKGVAIDASEYYCDDDEFDYDKLNFLGSTNKLHQGYKQVRQGSGNVLAPLTPTYNDYDEVHTIDSIRPADDSHLGYATVRTKREMEAEMENVGSSMKPVPHSTKVDHRSVNDAEYAVISKPKRV